MNIKTAFLYWSDDPAGRGIAYELKTLLKNALQETRTEIIEITKNPLYITDEDVANIGLENDTHLIILSKHSSESRKPSLTVHPSGNPTPEALLGGSPSKLSVSSPKLMKLFLLELYSKAFSYGYNDFYVGFEATHHGPTDIENPIFFIEIGSSLEMWIRQDLHKLIARVAINALENSFNNKEFDCIVTTGFGENHYPSRLTKRVIESNICVNHIIPRYALRNISDEIIFQAIYRSVPTSSSVLIEKNSVSKTIEHKIITKANELGLRVQYY